MNDIAFLFFAKCMYDLVAKSVLCDIVFLIKNTMDSRIMEKQDATNLYKAKRQEHGPLKLIICKQNLAASKRSNEMKKTCKQESSNKK